MKHRKHCGKDLTRKIEKNEGIYHVCRGMYFCDKCWEYLLDNERKYYRGMNKLKTIDGGGRMIRVLDACCGSKMFWFDKDNENVLFQDNRKLNTTLCDGRKLIIDPDHIGDFRDMDFPDNQFHLVVFDPPHLKQLGENSWMAQKYGKLDKDTWREDIKRGFDECWRVLKPNGTLIFKWNEEQIKLSEILEVIGHKPLFGNRRSKTHWLVFFKEEIKELENETS